MIRDRSGFTLVEILVSMLILGLVTPMLMASILGGLRISRQQSQDRSAATLWLQGEVEFLRRQCYPIPSSLAGRIPRPTPTPTEAQGEPVLPAVAALRDRVAPDAGYVVIESVGPVSQRVTVSYYRSDWGDGPPPASPAPDASTTTYVAEKFTGRCRP